MSRRPGRKAVTAWARLLRVQSQMLGEVHAALKAAGLPPLAWYDVLLELYRARDGGLRQYQIGERTLLPKYNLSRLIDRLERDGLVDRLACPEDGRGNLVCITARGTGLLERMWPVYGAVIHECLGTRLTREEVDALATILAKLERAGG